MYLYGAISIHLKQNEHTDSWQLIRRGDQAEFENLFKLYYKPLCEYAQTIMKDPDESEEIVQNTFYQIWSKKDTLDISSSIKSYLYRAVYNECLNKIKHEKVKLAYADDYRYTSTSHSQELYDYKNENTDLHNRIQIALNSLPEQCGIVFKLSRFEQLKYSEIANKLNISVKTVENHMGKALKIMRENLKEYLPLFICILFDL